MACCFVTAGTAWSLGYDEAAAWKYLVKQCDFGPRTPGTKAHDECRDFLLAELSKYTDGCRLQSFDYHWQYRNGELLHFSNIIGRQNWDKAKVHVVLTAHWDTRPFSDQDPDRRNYDKPIMGADDGASGVAVMLELAKELQKTINPDVGIEYVLNDGEDLGPEIEEMLLGIDYYADHLPSPKPDYGILLDMIGNKNVRVPIEPTGYDSSPEEKRLVDAFYAYAKVVGLDKTFPNERGPGVDDDHYPLIRKGIPTMDLIDFTYPAWHTIHDDVAHCSAESLGKIGTMLKKWFTMSPSYGIREK